MPRARLHTVLPYVAAAAIACDRQTTVMAPVETPDAAIVARLRGIGYRGPALIADRSVTDDRGTRPMVRSLYLPQRGLQALRRADAEGAGATAAMRKTLALTALAIAPDDVDPAHNSRLADLETVVSPSRLNGANPVQVTVNYSIRFISYDYATDQWYFVPAGEVLESVLRARDSSAGHWHGSVDTMQLREPKRVGRLVPATGTFTGSFSTQWRVAQVSMELSDQFKVREIGGPNNGDVNWFYSFANDGVRVQGLTQMPANAERYILVGGTPTHPEAFNDYATAGMISAIQAVANAFYDATARPATPTTPAVPGELTRVNDISLMYGGRFDIGRQVNPTTFIRCTDAATTYCWDYSHYEHRLGTEVDVRNVNWDTPARRKKFYDALKVEFPSIKPEGDHYHARTGASVYR